MRNYRIFLEIDDDLFKRVGKAEIVLTLKDHVQTTDGNNTLIVPISKRMMKYKAQVSLSTNKT
jgi:hypothetical protein